MNINLDKEIEQSDAKLKSLDEEVENHRKASQKAWDLKNNADAAWREELRRNQFLRMEREGRMQGSASPS